MTPRWLAGRRSAIPGGLLALTLGGFGIGLTEFVVVGLLPEVASDLSVSEASAGWLVTGYALSVAGGGVLMTAMVRRFNRKRALVGLMVLFIAGNLLSAVAPAYGVALVGRVIAALCHGAFFGIGAVVAADIVGPGRQARAISIMFLGLPIANVLGVPFGTFLGQQWGWRSTFWAITVVGGLALLALLRLIPTNTANQATAEARSDSSLRRELTAFTNAQVWYSLVITILGFGGMFGAFTYIAFTLTEVSGFATTTVPWLLVLFGAGLFAGNLVGGRAADRWQTGTLFITLLALVGVLAVFGLTARSETATVVSLLAMGFTGFATVPALQMRILYHAAAAPTLASAANISAFNLGNALGAWIGGLTISAGLGFVSPVWVGTCLTACSVVVLVVATRGVHRTRTGGAEGHIRTSASPSPAPSET